MIPYLKELCTLYGTSGREDAVREAKTYITEAIRAGATYEVGHGHGPVCHFWATWGA